LFAVKGIYSSAAEAGSIDKEMIKKISVTSVSSVAKIEKRCQAKSTIFHKRGFLHPGPGT
jgi:hypothetical protein